MKESEFQLLAKPSISEIKFDFNEAYRFPEEGVKLDNDIRAKNHLNRENKSVKITLEILIFNNKELADVPMMGKIVISGLFGWNTIPNEAWLETMLNENGPAILYSYVRPIISLLTVEANLPPLVLPIINFRK